MITLITYNLKSKEKDYTQFYVEIKTISKKWLRLTDSVWLVQTDEQPTTIKNILSSHMHSNDEIFVGRLDKDCSGYLSTEAIKWLEDNLNNVEVKEFTLKCQPE